MSSFHIGELHIKPERKAELLESLNMLKDQPGFISNTVYQSDEDENHITTVEEWESADDHKNFMASLPEGGFEAWVAMLSEPPKGSFYTKLG